MVCVSTTVRVPQHEWPATGPLFAHLVVVGLLSVLHCSLCIPAPTFNRLHTSINLAPCFVGLNPSFLATTLDALCVVRLLLPIALLCTRVACLVALLASLRLHPNLYLRCTSICFSTSGERLHMAPCALLLPLNALLPHLKFSRRPRLPHPHQVLRLAHIRLFLRNSPCLSSPPFPHAVSASMKHLFGLPTTLATIIPESIPHFPSAEQYSNIHNITNMMRESCGAQGLSPSS